MTGFRSPLRLFRARRARRRALAAFLSFLSPDPGDVGCDATFAAMAIYAEAIMAGQDPTARFPGVALHLRACDPCAEDLRGVLSAARVAA